MTRCEPPTAAYARDAQEAKQAVVQSRGIVVVANGQCQAAIIRRGSPHFRLLVA